MQSKGLNGSELHRLTEFTHYNKKEFERIYKKCQPLMRKLVKSIDHRRYGVSEDILFSYFEDKFLYVYNKYQDEYDEERLKATILSSLSVYKNKLLRAGYSKQAEFNQDLSSLEEVSEADKEDLLEDDEEASFKEDLHYRFHQFMKDHLSSDEYLVFITQLDPPPFITSRMSQGRITTENLIDFFGLPRTRKSVHLISGYRKHIKEVLTLAETDFHR